MICQDLDGIVDVLYQPVRLVALTGRQYMPESGRSVATRSTSEAWSDGRRAMAEFSRARYRSDMAFVVRLSPEDTEALREQAAREHRSMHEVAVLAIQARIAADQRAAVLDQIFDAAAAEDAELLDRLAR